MNSFSLCALALAASLPPAPSASPTALLAPPLGGCVPAAFTQELTEVSLCLGDSITLEVQATGTNLQYTWAHFGVVIPGATTNSLVLNDVTLLDRGVYSVEVSNECSSITSVNRLSISNCGGSYCTLTQGAYGNPNGQWNGMNRLELITSLLAQGPLVVGLPGRSLTIPVGAASAQCIIDRLPAGGPPTALPAFGDQVLDSASCQTNPPLPLKNGNFRNVLLGQTITLGLNLRLGTNLGQLVICSSMSTENGTFEIDQDVLEVIGVFGGGHDCAALFELANHALAGEDIGVSASQVSRAVDAINRAFDECGTLKDCH
jgi:hypothetical protein